MKKYNNSNFHRSLASDPSLRYNKQRYGPNISVGNNFQRYNQNQSGYQYLSNGTNTADCYPSNNYEKSSEGPFYKNSPKRINHKYQKQTNQQLSSYRQMSTNSAALASSPASTISSTSSSLSPPSKLSSTSNFTNLPPHPNTVTPQITATNNTQNNQSQGYQFTLNNMDSSNYFRFGYNFYPTSYNSDAAANASNTTYNATDSISSFMWQTIHSTPPPKLPQHRQPPPPLPRHPPPPTPPICPPLPPPLPTTTTDSVSEKPDQKSAAKTIVKMKKKRKSMSMRYKLSKSWSEKDAEMALKEEESNLRKLQKDIILIIRFPDPEISREAVKCYSPDIESVHFQLNFAPRYCLVHLKPGVNIQNTIDTLSNIPFGAGYLSVEIKQIPQKTHSTKLNEIDPYTLYVGNLPTTIAIKTLKEHFPGAARIDVGYAQRMNNTRYAFIRYQNVQQAIEAYRRMWDVEIEGRTLTIRFRRAVVANEGNKEGEVENHNEDTIDSVVDNDNDASNNNNSTDLANANERETENNSESTLPQESNSVKSNLAETIERVSQRNSEENETTTQATFNTPHTNIKYDPDDIVVRNNNLTSYVEVTNNTVKQEEEHGALYTEFFDRPNTQTESCERSSRNDVLSIASTTDETETMSSISSNSLAEFLQNCQRTQTQRDNTENLGPPPTKRTKVIDNDLQKTFKSEPSDKNKSAMNESRKSVGVAAIKQETEQDNAKLKTARGKNSSSNIKKSGGTHINTTDIDDVVPPTALFRSDYQNTLPNSSNVSDYDEFYETRVSSQASSNLPNVKKESIDISTSSRSRTRSDNRIQHNETVNISNTVGNNVLIKNRSDINPTSTTTTTTHIVDDDLVPTQNLLGSYRPVENFIKEESQYDDMFSVPFNNTSQLNDGISLGGDSVTNLTPSDSNRCKTTTEVSSYGSEDDDEDVVIISGNIARPLENTNSYNLRESNLTHSFTSRHADLVSLTHKPISVTISNREVPKLVYNDDLDKLYEQLDADSDCEF